MEASMKKTSTYARKKAVQQRQDEHETLLALIMRDLRGLQIDAGIHTWTGNDGAKMVNLAGRLCFITAFSAQRAGFQADHPDVRIVRGMAEALGDMAADLDNVERYRPVIQSGLAAIDRLFNQCDPLDMVLGSRELDMMLATSRGMGTADVRKAMGVEA
jgi:hypothetical protein